MAAIGCSPFTDRRGQSQLLTLLAAGGRYTSRVNSTTARRFRASKLLLTLCGLEGAAVAALWALRHFGDAPLGAVLALGVVALGVGLAAYTWGRFRLEHTVALASRQGVSLERHLASSVQLGVFANAMLVVQLVAQLR